MNSTEKIVVLKKASLQLVSSCKCRNHPFILPPYFTRNDHPWIGSGWQFHCAKCYGNFTFAEAVETDMTWNEWDSYMVSNLWFTSRALNRPEVFTFDTRSYLRDIKVGRQYVLIDGQIIDTAEMNLQFRGYYANHRFSRPPQVIAMRNGSVLDATLLREEYWQAHAHHG